MNILAIPVDNLTDEQLVGLSLNCLKVIKGRKGFGLYTKDHQESVSAAISNLNVWNVRDEWVAVRKRS